MMMSNRIFKATITLVAMSAMLFSWSLWPSVQGASQKTKGQKAQTTTQSRQLEAQKAIQEGALGRIASTANNSLRRYPSSPQIRNIRNPKIQSVLERGRKLLEGGKAATGWSAAQLSDYVNQVDRYLKEAEAVALDNSPTGGTKQEECGKAKDRCNAACHARDAGYFCFFDCRLEYLVCLGGTIFNISSAAIR